jgi:hypothetical protein
MTANFSFPLDGGKYEVQHDRGLVRVLRLGKPWRECSGDTLIYCLVMDIEQYRVADMLQREKVRELTDKLKKLDAYELMEKKHLATIEGLRRDATTNQINYVNTVGSIKNAKLLKIVIFSLKEDLVTSNSRLHRLIGAANSVVTKVGDLESELKEVKVALALKTMQFDVLKIRGRDDS